MNPVSTSWVRLLRRAWVLLLGCALLLSGFIWRSHASCAEGNGPTGSGPEGSEPGSTFVHAERDYAVPKELRYAQGLKGVQNTLQDRFYPIGWSRDGKFAYIREPVDEACGCYFFGLLIMDMVTNKTEWAWEKTFPYDGEEGPFPYTEVNELDVTWRRNYDLFRSKLNAYDIIQQPKFSLEKPSFSYGGRTYRVMLETTRSTASGFDLVTGVSISLESCQSGIKRLLRDELEQDAEVLRVDVAGCLRSPFEERIAILYLRETRGYEGPPNVFGFRLLGAHLVKDFEPIRESDAAQQ